MDTSRLDGVKAPLHNVSHAGMQRIKQAAIKLVEQSEFKYKMTANAKEQGLQRLGKQEALLKARAAYRQELYMENVQKIASEFQRLRSVTQRIYETSS